MVGWNSDGSVPIPSMDGTYAHGPGVRWRLTRRVEGRRWRFGKGAGVERLSFQASQEYSRRNKEEAIMEMGFSSDKGCLDCLFRHHMLSEAESSKAFVEENQHHKLSPI